MRLATLAEKVGEHPLYMLAVTLGIGMSVGMALAMRQVMAYAPLTAETVALAAKIEPSAPPAQGYVETALFSARQRLLPPESVE